MEAVGYTEGLSLVVLDVVFVGTASGLSASWESDILIRNGLVLGLIPHWRQWAVMQERPILPYRGM